MDANADKKLEPQEFARGPEDFARLDVDADGAVSLQEWLDPVSADVRADVVELLQRLHARLTAGSARINYNPGRPAGEQGEAVKLWQEWADKAPVE